MEQILPREDTKVSPGTRWASAIGGGMLLYWGLKRRSILFGLAGGDLIVRGATGHHLYEILGITALTRTGERASVPHQLGVRVDNTMTINASPEELYQFWRNVENLPRFMTHLASVVPLDDKRSHWIANGPAGRRVEWDAEIINEKENELIGWRSLAGSDFASGGSVQFNPAPGGRGTQVKVSLQYLPPAGAVGAVIAKLFGEEPEKQIAEDLRHLKQIVEAGEIPTTAGQPIGPKFSRARAKRIERGEQPSELETGEQVSETQAATAKHQKARAAASGIV